jgi:Cu-Zn family superoxide dismutase
MKNLKTTAFALLTSLFLLGGCQDTPQKKETDHEAVKVKMERIDEQTVKATVTIQNKEGDQQTETVEVYQGTEAEVKEKIARYTDALHGEHSSGNMTKKLKISLNAKSGSSTSGMVTLTETKGTVTLEAHINGLTEGTHAIHLHEKADCSAEDGTSTGGHWNPTFENHGAWGSTEGFHRGDIGNFEANTSGHGMLTFQTDLWCLDCDDPVKNIVGKAIIVHQGTDDLVSQPSGAAGARISCAGIITE